MYETLFHSIQKKSHNPISISVDIGVTSDPVIVANNFNDFFASIVDKVRSEIRGTNYHFSNFLKSRNRNSIFLSPTSPEEVLRVVDFFSETKSAGPHSIPVRILKLLKLDIASPISTLINRSFEMGIFPTLLKTSKSYPNIQKQGISHKCFKLPPHLPSIQYQEDL